MKTFYLVIFALLGHLPATAQPGTFTLTLNPFSFVERDGGFTPGIGYQVNDRVALYADLGLVFFTPGRYVGAAVETNRSLGYKFKPAVRFYVNKSDVARGSFFDLEGLYKHVVYNATDEIDVEDNNGNFAYTYIGGYTVKKDVYGFSVKYGHRSFLDKERRLGLDFYVGLGGRTKDFAVSGLPAGVALNDDPFNEDRPFSFFWRRGSSAYMPAGLKLFYNF